MTEEDLRLMRELGMDVPLTREQLRTWLDRPCPYYQLELLPPDETRRHLHWLESGVPLDQRPWEEFEFERVEPVRGAPFDEQLPPMRDDDGECNAIDCPDCK